MIHEEARVPPKDTPEEDDIFGDGDGETTEKMDYSKPFRLFDEQGLGVIPVDQFRLYMKKQKQSSAGQPVSRVFFHFSSIINKKIQLQYTLNKFAGTQ